MRSFLAIALMGLPALPAWADEPAKPNTLTPKEVEDGWILLFDGKTTFGWNLPKDAKVANGVLTMGGERATKATTTTKFGSFVMSFEYRLHGEPGKTWLRIGKDFGITLSSSDKDDDNWSREEYKREDFTGEQGVPLVPIALEVAPKNVLAVRSIKLKPLGLKPIFNGKDLTGWKEVKTNRTKSQFTVTPEGWLNIKNGPGDLQTEGQWGDFVLQIDCLSNGKNLNSGVFFRCQPDKYQQGYEAQIHNGFTAEPAKTYTLEEYDPKTHQKTGEKKVKYAAIDYGTGAIYRRQPARFQVAKDHEWFTMTIVAEGNHFAVWVNGIQVTDWTDNRRPSDNARNGFRKEKGPISLQGHDPTTNLSFRNIRIAELPKLAAKK